MGRRKKPQTLEECLAEKEYTEDQIRKLETQMKVTRNGGQCSNLHGDAPDALRRLRVCCSGRQKETRLSERIIKFSACSPKRIML